MASSSAKAKARRRHPASYDFLSQVSGDISYVAEHPLLAPDVQAELRKAQKIVDSLCYELHGELPTT